MSQTTANGTTTTTASGLEKRSEYVCPICYEMMREACVTKCGHSYCSMCILKSVLRFGRCPQCYLILTRELLFPNFALDELIKQEKERKRLEEISNAATKPNPATSKTSGLKQILTVESQNLSLPDVNIMLEILNQRKQTLEAESCASQSRLLHEFLKHLLKQKENQQTQVVREINLVRKDLQTVENTLKDAIPNDPTELPPEPKLSRGDIEMVVENPSTIVPSVSQPLNLSTQSKLTFQSKKRRMYTHFDDFVSSYFTARSKEFYLGAQSAEQEAFVARRNNHDDHMRGAPLQTQQHGLDLFRENLVKFSRYSTLRPLATMHYSSDLHISSTIVSTIVFDKDNELFAIGGVTKRIKVYDYLTVIKDAVDIHYPSVEMISSSKISCLAWNSYHKSVLASSDYEGAVNIWDVTTGQRTKCFHEHEKRCWSVDFNEIDASLMVSGSDDSRVKLWSVREEHSIATLEAKANVCCVKFNPKSSCHLSFGSADHDVHYYDLRNMSKAMCIFKGHKKAVSYVKFLNAHEIISASTDSQLKLWNVNSPPHSLRSFTGHINDKNFVGLVTDRDYIACGSEDNSLYLYYKGLSKQLFSYKIDVNHRVSDMERSNDLNEFVSAVCWRKNCDVILAANSRGLIKVLELV